MKIFLSTKFQKNYEKLPRDIKKAAKAQERIFLKNPFHPRLDTHKLHGKERDCWSYSVTYKIRIIFVFTKPGEVLYLNIGPHDAVY